MIGRPLRRFEDPRLVRGEGVYLDDIPVEGGWHAVFIRSIEAHALIGSVTLEEGSRGARLLTADELGLRAPMPVQSPSPVIGQPTTAPPLAHREVCYVGQPIAVVIARSLVDAVDAAESVLVDYEPLPAIVDYRAALAANAPTAHESAESNLAATLVAGFGDIDAVLGAAPKSLSIEFDQHRGAGVPIEGRGVLARWDGADGQLSIWTSSQAPYSVRSMVASYLQMSTDDVRVSVPAVGGGFGPKAAVYAEELVVAALAMQLRSAVKWVERRRENLTATLQQRGQHAKVEAAFDADGTILGLKARLVHDMGAFVPYGIVVPVTTLRLMSGPYVIPAIDAQIACVFTNATPTGAIRGAGRPNANFIVERTMDAIAHATGLSREDVRRRNFIPSEALPYRIDLPGSDGMSVEYDSGDYAKGLESALEAADTGRFADRLASSSREGRLRGYGIASYVEDTGVGPYDGSRVEVLPSGEVLVETGATAQGQGHATVFAQIVAHHLGVDPGSVRVRGGDTSRYPQGVGAIASRTGQTSGSAIYVAAELLAEEIKKRAALHLEASPADIVLEGGNAMVIGQPGSEIPLAELASKAQTKFGSVMTEGQSSAGLATEGLYRFGGAAYTFGTHVAEVEIDPETGNIEVVNYTVSHDCGTMLNPMIVDGQIDGGVAHGLGNALREAVRYSDEGQPLTSSLMDYLLTTADRMPPLTKVHTETPALHNPLGAKGAGEGGTIPVAAAIASAVEHALSGSGQVVNHYPITAEWVRSSVRNRNEVDLQSPLGTR